MQAVWSRSGPLSVVLWVETRLCHRIERRAALQGPVHRRWWCGLMVCSGRNMSCPLGSQCLNPGHPTKGKVQPCPQQGQCEAKVQSFCFIFKLSPSGARAVCWTHGVTCSWARECVNAQGKQVTGQAREKGGGGERGGGEERERACALLCSPRVRAAWVWDGPGAFSKGPINFLSFQGL